MGLRYGMPSEAVEAHHVLVTVFFAAAMEQDQFCMHALHYAARLSTALDTGLAPDRRHTNRAWACFLLAGNIKSVFISIQLEALSL